MPGYEKKILVTLHKLFVRQHRTLVKKSETQPRLEAAHTEDSFEAHIYN